MALDQKYRENWAFNCDWYGSPLCEHTDNFQLNFVWFYVHRVTREIDYIQVEQKSVQTCHIVLQYVRKIILYIWDDLSL